MNREAGLKANEIQGPDCLEKLEGEVITPHKNVLAIVNYSACRRVIERSSTPAQIRLLLKHPDSSARFCKSHPCRKACKSATDDENFVRHNEDSVFDSQKILPDEGATWEFWPMPQVSRGKSLSTFRNSLSAALRNYEGRQLPCLKTGWQS